MVLIEELRRRVTNIGRSRGEINEEVLGKYFQHLSRFLKAKLLIISTK